MLKKNMNDSLLSLKQELKCWESMFQRKYGRKPTKHDIDESSPEIKESYKKYGSLKREANKPKPSIAKIQEKQKPCDDDGVFGDALNKNVDTISPRDMNEEEILNDVWVPPKIKAKARVYNPPKLKKVVQEETTHEFKENTVINEKENGENDVLSFQISSQTENFTTSSRKKKRLSSKSAGLNKLRGFTNISTDFLTQCKDEVPLREINRAAVDDTNEPAESDVVQHIDNIGKDIISEVINENEKPLNESPNRSVNSHCKENSHELNEPDKALENVLSASPSESNPTNEEIEMEISMSDIPEITEDNQQPQPESDTSLKKKSKKSKKQCEKRKRCSKDDTEINQTNTKKIKLNKTEASKVKRLVSDNFVKIDLRKKTYQRGVSKLSASAMKRKSWKKKTSFEVPTKAPKSSWGMKKICFRCGGEGHWAKFCKGPAKKKNPFNSIDEEKNSIELEHLNTNKGSCFEHLDVEGAVANTIMQKNVFTINDVLQIEPVWPRHPFKEETLESSVESLFETNGMQPSQECFDCVKDYLKTFGYETFREGQHEAVSRVCSGLSTLVVLATGSGKSLCYQLPAYMYYTLKGYLTIVVSPLVALMHDQVSNLPSFLPGAFLNSSMTKLQQKRTIEKIKDGKIAVLLVSPETLVSGGFGTGILPPKSALPPIAFACVDEAHCLSEWSHNFRPSYLKVCKVLRDRYHVKCLLGLTATASQTTAHSVVEHLGIPYSPGSIIRDPRPIPENLHLSASRDNNRDQALVDLLQMKPFESCDSIIIYVTRRDDTERLATLLRTSLPERENDLSQKKQSKVNEKQNKKPGWWVAESYHAGLTPAQRKRVQKAFMGGELRIVVATVAFGMGLDKSDVRSVIHYNMPKSFENYVQEIGRAGRDGKPSYCHVFIDDGIDDMNELRRHIYGNTVDTRTIRKFVNTIFARCDCKQLHEKHSQSVKDFDGELLDDDEIDLLFAQYDGDIDQCNGVNADDCGENMKNDTNPTNPTENLDSVVPGEKSHEQNSTNNVNSKENTQISAENNLNKTYCSGHRFSIGVNEFVTMLDLPEENIATLFSYLDLHNRRYLETLNNLRTKCTIKCYGGPIQFQLLAKKFPPVALTLRYSNDEALSSLASMREIDVNVCEIADKMCWDVMCVLREVRSLQWNMAYAIDGPLNNTGKSGIIVESGDIDFHGITAGNLSDNCLDEMTEYLIETVKNQEETRLLQLDALYNVLRALSYEYFYQLPNNKRVDHTARKHINSYFLSNHTEQIELLKKLCIVKTSCETQERRWNNIASDVRSLMISYPDQNFSARSMAKIFQGISSPNYPAIVYGRDKRFWRQYIDVDFNELRIFCAKQIVRYKT